MMNRKISLIAIAILLGIAVDAAERIEFECPEPDGLFPHPVQCDRYFHCRNGIVNRKLCADGLVFDPDKDATFEEPCDLVQESAFGTFRAWDDVLSDDAERRKMESWLCSFIWVNSCEIKSRN